MRTKIIEAVQLGSIAVAAAGVLLTGASFAYDTFRDAPAPGASLDMGALPSSDCWYEVGMRDRDGKPGGSKSVEVETLCP